MNVLVINSGSSSIKYQLINIRNEQWIAKGTAERIGCEGKGSIQHNYIKPDSKVEEQLTIEEKFDTHESALLRITELLTERNIAVIRNPDDVYAVGHRVVHGGPFHKRPERVTRELIETLKKTIPLSPLHNPSNILSIEVVSKIFKRSKQYVVFDTGFHQSIPEKAHRYAIPEELYQENHIRVYGFHGISHQYVYEQAKKYLRKPSLKAITLHLGNGASMCAINDKGESTDTNMGLGPLSGLMMGTRCGDIDPTVIFYMTEQMNMSIEEVKNIFNRKSGILAIGGSNDFRDIRKLYENREKRGILCYDMYAYQIKKYIGAYLAALNGCDALIFTAGIGENDELLRELVCKELSFFGIELDKEKNQNVLKPKHISEIQSTKSKIKILVIKTNEELQIALTATIV